MMNEPNKIEGMSLVVKTVSHWLKAFLLVFGIYLVLYGHLTPGGGFPGGVIIACAFVLITLAKGERSAMKIFSKNVAKELDSIGALIFLVLGLIGLVAFNSFLENFISTTANAYGDLFSGGIIPMINIGIGLKVGASLFMVFTMLAALRVTVHQNGDLTMVRRKKEQS